MSCAQAEKLELLSSPDARISVSIDVPDPAAKERTRWSATFRRKPVFSDCELGLQTADAGELLAGARVVREQRRVADERIPVLFGKSEHANDRFHETRLTLETAEHRQLDVVFRCYDDGIAVRYELPEGQPGRTVTITDETTSFRADGNPTAYAQYLENYNTSHEHAVDTVRYSDIRPGALLDLPLTFAWADGTYAAITEAALRHYAGMALMRPDKETTTPRLVCKLTPRADGS